MVCWTMPLTMVISGFSAALRPKMMPPSTIVFVLPRR